MLFDRGPVPDAVELDARQGLELFHQLERELEEGFSRTLPISPEVLSKATRLTETLDVHQAMVICRRFGRACPHGRYWTLLVQRATELFGAPPADTPRRRTGGMSKMLQRITLRDLLLWADARGVLVALVAFLESFPPDGWAYMETD